MTSAPNFGWTDFYMEFANKLLEHKGDRAALLAKTREVVSNVMGKEPSYLDSCYAAKQNGGELPDICPFTVMGTFNRTPVTYDNRKAIAAEIREFLGVTEPVPDSFDGIPTLNAINSVVGWDVPYIDPLWQVFEDSILLGDSKDEAARQSFMESYDAIFGAKGMGVKLPIGLFWIRPHSFLSLDTKTTKYISNRSELTLPTQIPPPPPASEYLNLVDSLKDQFDSPDFPVHSFQELSWKAYEQSETPQLPNGAANPSIWVVRGGTDGDFEAAALEQGLTILGWGEDEDFTNVTDRDGVKDLVRQLYPDRDARRIGQITGQIAMFLSEMQVGDIVVMPLKTRSDQVALGRITGQYICQQADSNFRQTRTVDWIRHDVPRSDFDGIHFGRLTVFHIQDEVAKQRILALLDDEPAPPTPTTEPPYTIQTIIADGCFIEQSKLQTILNRLAYKKNLILQGPPGAGKTWLAKRLAYALIGQKDDARVRRLQFHPNLSYEDFIRGYRPNPDGKLDLVDGPFLKAVTDAKNDPDNKYVIVIEEINRGNPAQIFGEMLTLLEADKRNPDEALALAHSQQDGERVHIPPNLYVIGTMNVADRSIALVDLALRRRFAFIDLAPVFGNVWRDWVHEQCDVPLEFLANIERRVTELNDKIAADRSLGPQFRIGHSYLTPPAETPIADRAEWFTQVVETEIAPLLDEYWFDNAQEAESAKSDLLAGLPDGSQ